MHCTLPPSLGRDWVLTQQHEVENMFVFQRLLDDQNITVSKEHMWNVPFSAKRKCALEINFSQDTLVTGLRVWNYNQSFEDTYTGVSAGISRTSFPLP